MSLQGTSNSTEIGFFDIDESSFDTEDRLLFHLPLVIFYLLVLLFGILGNVLVLYIYSLRLRIPIFGFFIKILAVLDLITPCVVIPCLMVFRFAPDQIDTNCMCKILTMVKHLSALNSGLIFNVIACQRYRLICKPHDKQITESLAKKLCFGSVIFSLIVSLPIIYFLTDHSVFIEKDGMNVTVFICDYITSVKGNAEATSFSIWISLELITITAGLIFLYSSIGRTLKAHDAKKVEVFKTDSNSSHRTSTRTPTIIFFVLTVIFLISASPMVIISTYFSLSNVDNQWSYARIIFYDLGVDLLLVNCVVNPVVYSFTSAVFRKECKAVLCECKLIKAWTSSSIESSQENTPETFWQR